eukprot:620075-Pleurochrysis_carterae.AAC.8
MHRALGTRVRTPLALRDVHHSQLKRHQEGRASNRRSIDDNRLWQGAAAVCTRACAHPRARAHPHAGARARGRVCGWRVRRRSNAGCMRVRVFSERRCETGSHVTRDRERVPRRTPARALACKRRDGGDVHGAAKGDGRSQKVEKLEPNQPRVELVTMLNFFGDVELSSIKRGQR